MKKLLVIGIVVLLSLASCSIDWNNEKDTKISELETQITEVKKEKPEEDLFKKKQECGKYYKEIQQFYGKEIDGPLEVFYSPNNKTCFAAFPKQPTLPPDYNPNDPVNPSTPMVIIDWLTKAEYYITYSNAPEYLAKIKELKGE